MKVLLYVLFLLSPTLIWAVPDPRDSIILESKTVAPSTGPVATTMRVWITNKDSIAVVRLPLVEKSLSGGAYLTLAHPRTGMGAVNRLTSTLRKFLASFNRYNNSSPDSILLMAELDPTDIPDGEPPNSIRKPFLELKFDTVLSALGHVEFDSIRILAVRIEFANMLGSRVEVNFAKSLFTVVAPRMNLNIDVSSSSVSVVNQTGNFQKPLLQGFLPENGSSNEPITSGTSFAFQALPAPVIFDTSRSSKPKRVNLNGQKVTVFSKECANTSKPGHYPK